MGRIEKAYRTRFHWLLETVHARQLEKGVQLLVDKAQRLSAAQRISPADALLQVHEKLASKHPFRQLIPQDAPKKFFCDAGLGGLARWLRAAGYEAAWEPGIDDDLLLARARETHVTVLTTDSMLMERRVIRLRMIPAYWLPPTLSIAEQLRLVFQQFGLSVGERRCMSCGGRLVPGDKQALRERIPPRTFRWKDEYFVCEDCGKLHWHGTHWKRIHGVLEKVNTAAA